jgi:predicted CoA-binding protein
MDYFTGTYMTFTVHALPFTDNYFRQTGKLMKFEFVDQIPTQMTTLAAIESFLSPKKLAIIGASRNAKKFGRQVYAALKEKGLTVDGVNPKAQTLNGDPCYPDILSLPAGVDRVFIVTPPEKTVENVRMALDKGIRNIWIQQRSDTGEALELLKDADVNLIHNQCILMYAAPVKGPHKFHRFINKVFGKYPK